MQTFKAKLCFLYYNEGMARKSILRRKTIYTVGVILITIFSVFFLYESLEARAGGGHNYSAPRGSGGGGGGSGIGRFIFEITARIFLELIMLSIREPIKGLPLLGGFTFIVYVIYKLLSSSYVDSVIEKGSKVMADADDITAINNLRRDDPSFNKDVFKKRITTAFVKIQNAWTDRDLKGVEHFLSDGVYEQFSIQLDEYKKDHIIDQLDNLKVNDLFFLNYEKTSVFATIQLAIHAEGVNYRKDDRTNKLIEGTRALEPFAEVWTFVRRTSAKTNKSKGGLLEGSCPNCGNLISIGRVAKCEACGAFLRSGEHDWVLTKITQRAAWKKTNPLTAVTGYNKYKKSDPLFNIQNIEDKISVMFWRRNIAAKSRNSAYLRKISTNDFCDQIEKTYQLNSNNEYEHYRNCGVGSIDLVGISRFPKVDIALAKVVWAGKLAKESKGKIKLGPVKHKNEVFVLIRSSKAKTSLESSLSSAHCPSCGAPEETNANNECAYCGTVMNSGEKSWVLKEVLGTNTPKVRELLAKMQSLPTDLKESSTGVINPMKPSDLSPLELIQWAIAMMLADGYIDQRELSYLRELGRIYSVSEEKISWLTTQISSQPDPVQHVMSICSMNEPRKLIRHLIVMAMADGKISKEEKQLLINVARRSNLTEKEFKTIYNEERQKLYKASAQAIKTVKKAKKA